MLDTECARKQIHQHVVLCHMKLSRMLTNALRYKACNQNVHVNIHIFPLNGNFMDSQI